MRSLLLALALCAPAAAQTCLPGTVGLAAGATSAAPGDLVHFDVTGTPGARALMFWSTAQGDTTLMGPGPLGGTVVCLDAARGPWLLGPIPPAGALGRDLRVPLGAPVGSTLHFQAVTVDGSATPAAVDTSNVVSVLVAAAPPCAPGTVVLDIQPDTPVSAGTTVSFDVTGAPGAYVRMARSMTLGTTPIAHSGVDLCLGGPLRLVRFGRLDMNGALHRDLVVPPTASLPPGTTIYHQAVTLATSGGAVVVDTSNVDQISW